MEQLSIPPDLSHLLGDGGLVEESIGCSASRVFRLLAADGKSLFVKVSGHDEADEVQDEERRLRWLRDAGASVPAVIGSSVWDGRTWLVTECIPGVDAAQSGEPIATRVAVMAKALRDLHAIDVGTCPFDETLPVKIARAEKNVRRKRVREELFDDAHWGISAADLVVRLRAQCPDGEDIVLTHGDACLPNVLLQDGRFSGFVDCGSAGRADRYHDLALASRSIRSAFGPDWVGPFFEAYGLVSIDQERIDFYRLMDNFF